MPTIAIPLAGLTVLATLIGGRIGLRFSDRLPTLLALTGGVVVAVALLDVLPEGLDAVDDTNLATVLVAAGFLGFFLAARLLVLHDRDEAVAALGGEKVGVLGAAGLSAHSFLDGLGIGFAFGVDSATGLLVFLAVISHDFADGLNTVSYVLRRSGDRQSAVKWLTIDALAPLLGAIVGTQATISDHALGYVLCVYCGIFLYIGACDLLPEAHAQGSAVRVGLTALGFLFVFGITRAAGI
ncbi:MAG TPA: ZIP family metal transporter [Solirubrobacterales bacterium]|jgi:ZIP family zinc transporter|nr:ZIP family metal transporter [Solirubrobacterales bacterium]